MQDFYETEMQELLQNTGVLPSGCLVFLGCPESPYGRKHITFPGQSKSQNEYVHRISIMLRDRIHQSPAGLEASHLCGIKKCIRQDHIVWETKEVNSSRRTCHRLHECQPKLNHTPQCIVCK